MKSQVDEKGKRIFIELGSHLQLEIKENKMCMASELLGMEVGNYLIVKIPKRDESKRNSLENQDIFVKYFHIDSILGFHSRVISLISEPDDLVFISYPRKVESCNARTESRLTCFMPVKLEIEYNIVEGIITDINKEGCCCEVKNFKLVDEHGLSKVTIFLQKTMMRSELTLLGTIRSVRQIKDEVKFGIMFDEVDTNTQTVIQSVIPLLDFNN